MSDHLTEGTLRQIAEHSVHPENRIMATELLAKREECEKLRIAYRCSSDTANKKMADVVLVEIERDRYRDALVARHGGEPVALLSELDEARADLQAMTVEAMRAGRELAAVKRQREELIRAKTGKSPDDLFCCNGLECGCQGVTVGEYELYCVDRAIEAASQTAQQPKPEGGVS